MTTPYASGRRALGICDRCGRTCDYKALQYQIFDQKNQQIKVCPECLDEDQPQLQVGRIPINDPQALYQPRPDTGIQGNQTKNSRWLFAWDPVGSNLFPMAISVGQVTASSS